jgi:hypothetical protein
MARQRVGTTRNDCSPGGPQALAEVTDLTGLQRLICSTAAPTTGTAATACVQHSINLYKGQNCCSSYAMLLLLLPLAPAAAAAAAAAAADALDAAGAGAGAGAAVAGAAVAAAAAAAVLLSIPVSVTTTRRQMLCSASRRRPRARPGGGGGRQTRTTRLSRAALLSRAPYPPPSPCSARCWWGGGLPEGSRTWTALLHHSRRRSRTLRPRPGGGGRGVDCWTWTSPSYPGQ